MSSLSRQWIQKLSQFKKLQKTASLNYTILKTLCQSLEQQPSIAKTQVFQSLLKSLPQQIHSLQLYSQLIHRIWREQSYPIQVRQACCPNILQIVTQWIMHFQLQSQKAISMSKKISLIKNFIWKHSRSIQMTILIVDQVYEDLRDFLDGEFWALNKQNDDGNNNNGENDSFRQKQNKYKNGHNNQLQNVDPHTAHEILSLLQLLVFRQVQIVYNKNTNNNISDDFDLYLSALKYSTTTNYYDFVLNSINYLFSLNLSQSQQCQGTKIALQFMKSLYCLENQQIIIGLFKLLMLSTKKSVRFALVQEYMQVYRLLSSLQKYDIIQQLQEMTFFRQLIVGHSKVTQNIKTHGLQQAVVQKYFNTLIVKAGSKQRVYFSLQDSESGMLKLQLMLQEGMDINLKFIHFSTGNKQTVYHQVPKTDLSKLHLKINFMGMYAVEFDNSYSWLSNKTIKYHLHLLKCIDAVEIVSSNLNKQELNNGNQIHQ